MKEKHSELVNDAGRHGRLQGCIALHLKYILFPRLSFTGTKFGAAILKKERERERHLSKGEAAITRR